jgi:predicted ATPase
MQNVRLPVGNKSPGHPAGAAAGFGITEVEVHGFRSAHEAWFAPASLCALIGEANAGKSNLLAAIRAALDPVGAPLRAGDATAGGEGSISVRIGLAGGEEITLRRSAGGHARDRPAETPPVLFLPAEARASTVIADGECQSREAARAAEVFRAALDRGEPSSAAPALAVVDALESWCAIGVHGLVLLIEEPELYLRPQLQRYLYRSLRRFSRSGNQVIYSTHSPAFLNVARLDELIFVERLPQKGTHAAQPVPVTPEQDFRVLTEFDTTRSELFLARSVVLVEGETERLALPFVFAALGHDADREAISIVECGGKSNIPLFARICDAVRVPFLAIYDSDSRPGRKPIAAELALNALIAEVVEDARRFVLEPDFEAVAGLKGRNRKPERAWRHFASLGPEEVPKLLAEAVERAVSLARER